MSKVSFWFLMISVLMIYCCNKDCNCTLSEFQQEKLIELDSLINDPESSEFRNVFLAGYNEKEIFKSDNETYRYFYQGAFGRKKVIRIEKTGEKVKLSVQESERLGENYYQDSILRKEEHILSEEDWNSLKTNLEVNCFWTMPYHSDSPPVLDGYGITIEAFTPFKNECTGKQFHVVSGWVPIDSSFIAIYENFENLANRE